MCIVCEVTINIGSKISSKLACSVIIINNLVNWMQIFEGTIAID